jgi:hypothetical protein
MSMWRMKMIAVAVLILVVSGCSRSNPLLGRWKVNSAQDPGCIIDLIDTVEFTEKGMTLPDGLSRTTYPVTYRRDGDAYLVTKLDGTYIRFKTETGGIEANGCHYVRAN